MKFFSIFMLLMLIVGCGKTEKVTVEGKPGKDGRDGYSSLIATSSASSCQLGGLKLDLFLDKNYNDQPDVGEFVYSLGTICNGLNGSNGEVGATGPQGIQGATGPQGIQGIQGAIGPIGPQGVQGIAGVQGATGPAGPKGLDGTQGVKGDAGAVGATGSVGATGPKGEPGLIGKSAYQVAVENGFTGTQTQWLASLNGTNGTNGEDGEDSTSGVVPVKLCSADNSAFPEYGFIINQSLYAVYYGQIDGVLSTFLARLTDGVYVTTNNTNCRFEVSTDEDGDVVLTDVNTPPPVNPQLTTPGISTKSCDVKKSNDGLCICTTEQSSTSKILQEIGLASKDYYLEKNPGSQCSNVCASNLKASCTVKKKDD